MMDALSEWWANPVTAILGVVLFVVLLWAATAGLVGMVRLGGIQLVGLLAHRERLLPRVPRRGEVYTHATLALASGVAVLLALFIFAVVKVGVTLGLNLGRDLAVVVAAWVAIVVLASLAARGDRVERFAELALVALWPWTPLLRRLVPDQEERHDEEPEDDDEDDDEEIDEHEVKAFIGAGEAAGILEREDAELIASIVELADTVAREIMTPRTDVVALPVDADFATVKEIFSTSMFTRIPVFRETLDRIEGLLHVKDVFLALGGAEPPPLKKLLRPILVVPETKPLRDLLREFQTSKQQLAVVVDEYGGTSGIVSLEDILEEIVGEIQDEHQSEEADVEEEEPGVYLLAGGAHVNVLESLFDIDIDDAGFDSVAGMLLDRLGHLPRPGETVTWQGVELEAVEVERRRLRRVRARRVESQKVKG